ncbi:MAG: rod shape-determining protein MreD [Winogradskyella sp.]|uniref:rod shape-determining protein MreD n=1 Tax=Winogradskyella sp. TaxID=1883156 RepID=UPI000F4023D7|nr:rod shape-determining protein MreD [Winogradskyella sp.]RNC85097.1 MAG: rod shape-determining protein MreD [Winogradskyella sp.]
MTNGLVANIIRFIALLIIQVSICSSINFLGYINPYIYIIFIILFPINANRLLFLICAFNLGLLVDMFLDSGGVHAGASVFLAYARPIFLKYTFGTLYDHQTIKFGNLGFGQLFGYIALTAFFHHFILFILEIFNIYQILLILKKTLFTSILTIILSTIIILLFRPRK